MKLSDSQIEILLSANEAGQLVRCGSYASNEGCAVQILYGIKHPSDALDFHPELAIWFDNLFNGYYGKRKYPTDKFAKELVARFGRNR